MKDGELDTIDRRILVGLHRDGRATMTDLADGLGVSPNTVRNRIRALEDAGVIEGYTAVVNDDAADYPMHSHFTCSASIGVRSRLASEAREITDVLGVRELLTGQRNVLIEAVGTDRDDITRIERELDELGLDVVEESLVRRTAPHVASPFEDSVRGAGGGSTPSEDADGAPETDGN